MNLTLRQKIFLGYVVIICFALMAGVYAILSLRELNDITSEIVYGTVQPQEELIKLNDCLLAQDLHEKRLLTLRHADAESLFWARDREFRALLSDMVGNQSALRPTLDALAATHAAYGQAFTKEVSLVRANRIAEAGDLSSSEIGEYFKKMLQLTKDLDVKIKTLQITQIDRSTKISSQALTITIALTIVIVVFGLVFATLITNHVSASIVRLKAATDSIISGNFDNIPDIKGADELADLAISFREMSTRLRELEEVSLDASPLTKLPGNLAIEKELLTRLSETSRFSFCLVDIDNFKGFNDRYGYARGSDVIKWLGEVLLGIKKDLGAPEDFLGHIGGDDFVVICDPDRVQAICNTIIEQFDKGIGEFYDPEDLKKGFIVSIDRDDKPAVYSIMTLSIAVVNTDRTLIREPKEIALKVTELKQYAKTFAKSICIMDRRRLR